MFIPAALTFYWVLLKQAVQKFGEDNVFVRAAALSYYTIFSLPPMLLVILRITTYFYDREAIQRTIYGRIADAVGDRGAMQLNQAVNSLGLFEGEWWSVTVGVIGLLITSTTVFVTMQDGLNQIFRVKPKPRRGWLKLLRDRLLSFAILLSIAFILIVSLVANAVISGFGAYIGQFLPDFSLIVLALTSFFLPFVIITGLFGLIFRYLPDVKLPWRDIWVGATVTAVLFFFGKYLIEFYIGTANTANLYEAAGSIMVIMLWMFYASVIFLFGATFTYVYTKEVEGGIVPASYAVPYEFHEIEREDKRPPADDA